MTKRVDQRVHMDGMLSRHLVAPVLVFMYLMYTDVVHKEFKIVIRKDLIVWTYVLFSSVYLLVTAVRNSKQEDLYEILKWGNPLF